MSSNNQYEHQKYWKEEHTKFVDQLMKSCEIDGVITLGDGIMAQIERDHKDQSKKLLEEINLPENLDKINDFFKNYKTKHTYKKDGESEGGRW
jgi:hypothetical protein